MRIEDGLIVNNLYLSSGATYITSAASNFNVVSATDYFDTTFSGNYVLVSSPTKQIAESSISTTKLGYLTDVTSNIQAQLNTKQNIITNPVTGTGTVNRLAKFSSTSGLSNSNISDDGTTISLLGALSTNNVVRLKPDLFNSLDANYVGNGASLLSKPYDYQTHDWSAYTSPMYEVYDGSVWTSASLNTKLFDGFPSTPVVVITSASSIYGSRWTWNNATWSDINTIIITANYTNNTSPLTFTVQTAVSGTTDWTTINTFNSNGLGAQTLYLNVPAINGNNYLRLILEIPDGKPLSLTSIQLISGRIGDQGKSKYNYLPFSWDYNKLVTFNNTIANTVTAQKFVDSNYVGDRVLVSLGDKSLEESSISTSTLNHLSGVSSNIQLQLDGKSSSTHTHSYLPLSGGSMSGSITFANNTWNTIGDDVQLGDINAANVLGFRGAYNNTIGYIRFGNSTAAAAETVASDFGWNGTEFRIGANRVWHLGNLVGDQTAHYHSSDRLWSNLTSVPVASTSTSGVLTSTDWNTFNNKQASLTSASNIVVGNISATSFVGNASSSTSAFQADKLKTGRTISITGDLTYTSPAFDGTTNVTAVGTLANVGTAGTYTKVTTDSKGRVTSGGQIQLSDISGLQSTYLPLAGGTMTGDITFQDDGEGITFFTGARVYKKIGTGLVIKRESGEADPRVENYMQSASWKILHEGNISAPIFTSAFTTSFVSDIFGNSSNSDYHIRVLRTSATAPTQLLGNYSTGIAWKGMDTFGAFTVNYNTANIRFMGGNGTGPAPVGQTGFNWTTDLWHSSNLAFGTGNSNMARGDHNHNGVYLPLAGGTMTGNINMTPGTRIQGVMSSNDNWWIGADTSAASDQGRLLIVVGDNVDDKLVVRVEDWSGTSYEPVVIQGNQITFSTFLSATTGNFISNLQVQGYNVWHAGNLVGTRNEHNHNGVYAPISHGHSWSQISATPTTLSGYGISPSDPYLTNVSGYIRLQNDYNTPQVGYGVLSAGGGFVITSGTSASLNQTLLGYNSLVMTHGSPRLSIVAGDTSVTPSISLAAKSGFQDSLVLKGHDGSSSQDFLSFTPSGGLYHAQFGTRNGAGYIGLGDNGGNRVFGVGYDNSGSVFLNLQNFGQQIFDISYTAGNPRISFGTGGASTTRFVTSTTEENFITSDLRIIQGGLRIYGQMVITSGANASFIDATLANLGPGYVVVSDSNRKLVSANVTTNQINYLSATTSDIQAQLNAKADKVITFTAGTGLTGGGSLSANRTFALATTGTSGTYTKVVTDIYGRVTSGGSVQFSDVVGLSTNYLPLSGGTMTRAGGAIVNWNNGMRHNIYSDAGTTLKAIYTTSGNTYYGTIYNSILDVDGVRLSGTTYSSFFNKYSLSVTSENAYTFNAYANTNDAYFNLGKNSKVSAYTDTNGAYLNIERQGNGGIFSYASGNITYIEIDSYNGTPTSIRLDASVTGPYYRMQDATNNVVYDMNYNSYSGASFKLTGPNTQYAYFGSGLGSLGGNISLYTSASTNIQLATDSLTGAEILLFNQTNKGVDIYSGTSAISPSIDLYSYNSNRTVSLSAHGPGGIGYNGYLSLGRSTGLTNVELYSNNNGSNLKLGTEGNVRVNLESNTNGGTLVFNDNLNAKYFEIINAQGTAGKFLRFMHSDGTTESLRLNSNGNGVTQGGLFFFNTSGSRVFDLSVNQNSSSLTLYSDPGSSYVYFSPDVGIDNYIKKNLDFQSGAELRVAGSTRLTSAGAAILTSATVASLTNNRVVVSNSSNQLVSSNISTTQLNYLSATTSDVQSQLNTKANSTITITGVSGLTGGGDLTTNRTLSLATTGTSGTYRSVTTDVYGRVTAGTNPTTLTGYGITSTDTMFDAKYINVNQKAVANGVATLDASVKLPVAQLPDIIDCGTF